MPDQLLQTAWHAWHVAHNGRMVDFAGWDMPVQYASIVEEHHAVRTNAGLFDVAHMGRLKFTGPDACMLLDALVTNDVTKLAVGQVRYALVTNENGGILDDVLVYRFSDCYMLVVNASNREKIVDWFSDRITEFEATMEDRTCETSMLALQGPQALRLLDPLVSVDLASVKYYHGLEATIDGTPGIVTRTGYTGEDGFEVILPSAEGATLWQKLIDAGAVPCGLGCRDTLRLEAAMPLYGHEMDETTDPLTAGLTFGVRLKAGDFIGKDALLAIKQQGPTRQRIGFELEGRRIAREGATLHVGETQVGTVTSGTFSPTLQKAIGMAYVDHQHAGVGTQLEVDIRGKLAPARVVKLPFYSRK